MHLRMVTLKRNKAGEWIARKSIPKDARAAYARLWGVGWEAILKLPAETSKANAKARLGEWLAEVETRIANLRAAARGDGEALTVRNAVALAGVWRTWFIERHASDLRTPKHWEALKDHFIYNILEPHAPDAHHAAHGTSEADATWPWLDLPEVFAATAPTIREVALTASFLASQGLKLTAEADGRFSLAATSRPQPNSRK